MKVCLLDLKFGVVGAGKTIYIVKQKTAYIVDGKPCAFFEFHHTQLPMHDSAWSEEQQVALGLHMQMRNSSSHKCSKFNTGMINSTGTCMHAINLQQPSPYAQ